MSSGPSAGAVVLKVTSVARAVPTTDQASTTTAKVRERREKAWACGRDRFPRNSVEGNGSVFIGKRLCFGSRGFSHYLATSAIAQSDYSEPAGQAGASRRAAQGRTSSPVLVARHHNTQSRLLQVQLHGVSPPPHVQL